MRARASGEAVRNEGLLIYFSPYIGVLVLVFLLSLTIIPRGRVGYGMIDSQQAHMG